MPVSHADFFATLGRPTTATLQGVYADVYLARVLMAMLYEQAALLVMAARGQGLPLVLTESAQHDGFEIKAGLQTAWIRRDHDKVTIGFTNFARGLVPDGAFPLVPEVGEERNAFAARTMIMVRAAFWPEHARTLGL